MYSQDNSALMYIPFFFYILLYEKKKIDIVAQPWLNTPFSFLSTLPLNDHYDSVTFQAAIITERERQAIHNLAITIIWQVDIIGTQGYHDPTPSFSNY